MATSRKRNRPLRLRRSLKQGPGRSGRCPRQITVGAWLARRKEERALRAQGIRTMSRCRVKTSKCFGGRGGRGAYKFFLLLPATACRADGPGMVGHAGGMKASRRAILKTVCGRPPPNGSVYRRVWPNVCRPDYGYSAQISSAATWGHHRFYPAALPSSGRNAKRPPIWPAGVSRQAESTAASQSRL